MLYDFECQRCLDIYEEFRDYEHRNDESLCPYCLSDGFEGKGIRLISCGTFFAKDKLFEFTDYNTTGKPVHIRTKGQWQRHLKSLGMHDDVSQSNVNERDLKLELNPKSREQKRKEIKQALVNDLASAGKIRA